MERDRLDEHERERERERERRSAVSFMRLGARETLYRWIRQMQRTSENKIMAGYGRLRYTGLR